MDTQRYKTRLLDIERELTERIARLRGEAKDDGLDSVPDSGDRSLADETKGEAFAEADQAETRLGQVRDALGRIEAGTYGACAVDGGPIGEKRLEAVPWAAYCVEHERQREGAGAGDAPTL